MGTRWRYYPPGAFLSVVLTLWGPGASLAGQILALRPSAPAPVGLSPPSDTWAGLDPPAARTPPWRAVPATHGVLVPIGLAGATGGVATPLVDASPFPERAGRASRASDDDPGGPDELGPTLVINPASIRPSQLAVSEMEFSTLVVSTMNLSVIAGTAPAYTSMSSDSVSLPGPVGYHSLGGGGGLVAPPDPDRDEEARAAKTYYIKPIGGVIGTALLFLAIGLIFLRGRREGDAF